MLSSGIIRLDGDLHVYEKINSAFNSVFAELDGGMKSLDADLPELNHTTVVLVGGTISLVDCLD